MKKVGYYILYVGFLVLLLYLGSRVFQYLRVLTGRTFVFFPLRVFMSVFPIFVGMYLALPNFISKVKSEGNWSVDWIKLVTIGTVSFLLALAPVISLALAPIASIYPQVGVFTGRLLMWLHLFNQAVTISGVVFGYLVLSVPQKVVGIKGAEHEEKNTV